MTQFSLLDQYDYSSTSFPEPRPFQARAHEKLRDGRRRGHKNQLLMAPTGAGKCLGRDTPVLMADGSIKMVQDVVPGDRLLGPDGGPRNVLSIARGREQMYRVTPTKGDSYSVNASHILSLRKTNCGHGLILADGSRVGRNDDIVNVNVKTLAESGATARHCLKGWRAPAVEFPDSTTNGITMPPYILGAWLGDGTTDRASICKPDGPMVAEWVAYAKTLDYEVRRGDSNGTRCPTWLATNGMRGRPNIIQETLRGLGVAGCRHVPAAYKFAPIPVRLELLAGLIDSDGHVSNKGFDWITRHEALADDVAFICRSLGLAAYVSQCSKGIKSTGFVGTYWRVSISGDTERVPCRAKPAGQRLQKKRHLVHGIKIEPIGEGDYYGFEIDGDHLFLLGDFTVTHNTYLGLNIIQQALAKGRRATFVCDRTTLIEQTIATSKRYGLKHLGVIQSDHILTNSEYPFQIASAQTLASRGWHKTDVIVVDEAHTQLKAWTEHINETDATVIGLSATPFSKGLGKLFTNLVVAATMHELTESGVLVPMRVYSCTTPDMSGAATANGEWTAEAAEERGMSIVGDVVTEWVRFGENRKTICFGATVKHCEELCSQFVRAGIMATLYTGHTTPKEREDILREFTKPDSELRVLISVEALAKGFDVQDVGCVIDCRPMRKSLSTVIQMWGRGLRSSPETGKLACILLDHSGNIIRFKDDFEEVYFNGIESLDMGEKMDSTVRKDPDASKPDGKCPACGYKPFFRRCMKCGHERAVEQTKEHLPGAMQEIKLGKVTLDRQALFNQCVSYARANSKPEKQYWRAQYLYKEFAGDFPPKGDPAFDFNKVPADYPVTDAVRNKIRYQNIKRVKAQQKVAA